MNMRKKLVISIFFLFLLLSALAFMILYPVISTDYTNRAIVIAAIQEQNEIISKTGKSITTNNKIDKKKIETEGYYLDINDNGYILFAFKQIKVKLLFIPETGKGSEVSWKCYSDNHYDVPAECRYKMPRYNE